MKKYLLLILVAFAMLVRCGSQTTTIVPPDVLPYYNEFYTIVKNTRYQIGTIKVDFISSTRLAQCQFEGPNDPWLLILNQDYWSGLGDEQRRILIYHELTHCTFHAPQHSLDPNSYMYSAQVEVIDKDILELQVKAYTDGL